MNLYVALGLEETVAYYNAKESVDGQWYVFIIDENQTIIAHAPDPDLVGKHVSQALGPNSYPTGSAVAASADYYTPLALCRPSTPGWSSTTASPSAPAGTNAAPSPTPPHTSAAGHEHVALGLEEAVAYYNARESIDEWYVFIIDENQTIIAHAPDPDLVGKHVSQALGPNSYPTGPPSPPPPTRTAPGSTTRMRIPPLALCRPSTPG